MDIKEVTIFLRKEWHQVCTKRQQQKKNTDYRKTIHFHMYAAALTRCGLESLHRLSYQLHALKSIWIRVGLYITQSYKGYAK